MARALIATVAVLLCAASATAGTPRSGLYGVVTRGPVRPVCVAEQPCSQPYANAVLVFSRGGSEVSRTTADATGHYRIRLTPGVYAVHTARGGLDATATVRRGAFAHVDFDVDTGIR